MSPTLPIVVVCQACGAENPERAKFCLECGVGMQAAAPAGQVRKTVSVLFCDVTGSTALGERLDAEAMRSVMSRYFAAMSRVVQSHGGTVEKFIGDAVMAVFGVPVLHEDDALRALRAAVGMRAALEDLNTELERDHGVRLAARIGVNTGEVVVGTGGEGGKGTVATGDAVNVAARLEQTARPGDILLGEATWALVRHHARAEAVPALALKGKGQDVRAWRLLDVVSADEAVRPLGLSSPLVGRDREVALLEQALERSAADRRPQLVTVLGAAGVGKSRLVEEVFARRGRVATVLASRCLSYGEDIVFWPLQQMLRQTAGLTATEGDAEARDRLRTLVEDDPDVDRVLERLAPLAGLRGTPAEAEEIQWAVRRLVESLGRRGPVALVLDDVHWAQPALLDTIEHLADWTRDTPLLIVCLARPEFLDDHPQWGGGKLNTTSMLLEPLGEDSAAALLDSLLGPARLPKAVRTRILAAASGVPLFVEQMLAMLADDGVLSGEGGPGPSVDAAVVDVPPTIAALLAARLDRLPPAERVALEAASVVGTTFYLDAVVELVGQSAGDVGRSLMALTRKELTRPDRSDLPGEEGFRFLHVLVRDAAYSAVPKAQRADLHERFARWLDKRGESLGLDVDQFVGYHLEQAVHLLHDLGPLSEAGHEAAAIAADRLGASGRRLLVTHAPTAASLLRRSAALMPPTDPARIDRLRAAARPFFLSGDLVASRDCYQAAVESSRAIGDERRALLGELELEVVVGRMRSDVDPASLLERADDALQRFRAAGDNEGIVTAGLVKLEVLNEYAAWGSMVDLADELLEVSGSSPDGLVPELVPRIRAMALFYGPTPMEQALQWHASTPPMESRLGQIGRAYGLSAILAHLDRGDEARAAVEQAESLLAEHHTVMNLAEGGFGGGICFRELGDLAAAERIVRRGVEALQAIDERGYLSSMAPDLGDIRFELGDLAEARAMAELGRDTSPPQDGYSQAGWRALLARVEAAEGDQQTATGLADEAVTWIERTDQAVDIARFRAGRAEVHQAAGRTEAARADLLVALETYERKGSRTGARRIRAQLAALPAVPST
ncbi:MAG: AAA family ATPase [Sporichthyaceae bacterium]|nr:AAA family ATPase [Sporichthyaceae bacterium]